MHKRAAFTLMELVVVVVIISILATLAVISLGGTMDHYQLSRAAETIEMFDARGRRDARTARAPVQGTIQRYKRCLEIETPRPQRAKSTVRYQLPRSVEIKTIRLRRRVTVGSNFEIRFNREGSSPTYAVQLQRGETSRWLVVLGLSGQIITLDSEGEVDEFLSF
jgi:prepilin-type N-terminal cleavage/methylation domain-containing protein